MDPREAEELTQGLGQVHAGSWRVTGSLIRLGVPKALGLTDDEWVQDRLGGTVRMAVGERRIAVRELADEDMTQRQIAATLGVNEATVNRDVANATGRPKKPRSKGSDVANATDNTAELEQLRKQNAELERKLADKPKVTGQDQIQAQLQQQVKQLEATVSKQTQQMMEIAGEKSDLLIELEKLATSPADKQKQRQIAEQLHNRFQREQTKRAGNLHNPNAIASSIIDVTVNLDRWIQAHEDTITEVDARNIVAEYKKLGEIVEVLQSRVAINEL